MCSLPYHRQSCGCLPAIFSVKVRRTFEHVRHGVDTHSRFAGLAGQVRLRGLSPLQVMCASRGIIETFYPRSQAEVDMFPHLKTLVPYLSFFAPVKVDYLAADLLSCRY